ncbi:MAG: CTP synthase [Candidatus Eisenbacteria bacterium]|nr:CTP synthase [Candidatus Eisenbacteria bacterium]
MRAGSALIAQNGERRHIFVTGGVVSSLGKGIASASLGMLLKSRGFKVTLQKFDPYLNVDPGTMSPFQHGEVFVTDDGAETDLDLGHYERFTDQHLEGRNCVTSGQIYDTIISKERRGEFLGKTVQVIPHVTEEIKRRMLQTPHDQDAEINIIEIGGTVGDMEGLPFLEAIRQLRLQLGKDRVLFIHLTLVPYIKAAREPKTKPTQHSVRRMTEIGIQPDILVCRSEMPLGKELRDKIALFCNVSPAAVIENVDCPTIYQVPLALHEQGLDALALEMLRLEPKRECELDAWRELVTMINSPPAEVEIALVGKYTHLHDAYKSILEAFLHAGVANRVRVAIRWIESSRLESGDPDALLDGVHGVHVPGGFGVRGIEGMVRAVRWARERQVPFFGICLGLQCTVVEFARSVCGLEGAHSTEFDSTTPHPVVDLLPEQKEIDDLGGTMRLGASPVDVQRDSLLWQAYNAEEIHERHRHRYEVNETYHGRLEAGGLRLTGTSREKRLVEVVELADHPWFVASQFHPEFKSRPRKAAPLFREFVRAAKACADARGAGQGGLVAEAPRIARETEPER